jgi:hypothetical protein
LKVQRRRFGEVYPHVPCGWTGMEGARPEYTWYMQYTKARPALSRRIAAEGNHYIVTREFLFYTVRSGTSVTSGRGRQRPAAAGKISDRWPVSPTEEGIVERL